MKFPKVKAILAAMGAIFAWGEDPPIDAENKKLKLTDEQAAKLKEVFGEETALAMKESVDGEIKAHLEQSHDLKAIHDELTAILKGKALAQEELDKAKENGNDANAIATQIEALNRAHSDEKQKRIELEEKVRILMELPEGDVPGAVIENTNRTMKHSATHLFASNKEYNAFEKRPWNARLRDTGVKATNFIDDSNIPTLQGDLEHFVRENPAVINSLFNDFADLPKEWSRRSGVLDRVTDGFVIAGEIVQGRSKGWAPKNRFKFSTEEGRVYRKKIDITFDGYELQQIENTWVGTIKNSDGSHPWKMSFIGFLLSELVKRQKLDDRMAQVNGIYVEGPGGDTPGAAVNSQNGLRYLWYYYRDMVKKFRPFSSGLLAGAPTPENIVDYIEEMIMAMPEEERNESGLEIQLSPLVLQWYRKRAGLLYQHHYNADTGEYEYKENYPIDHPNFIFQPLKDMTKTLFIGITQSSNVQILDYDVSEKGKFTITHTKRDTDIFADYRLGIRFIMVGNKLAAGEPDDFLKQKVWSNSMPVFGPEVSVPAFDDETGILKVVYPNITVDKGWVTDITDMDGIEPGQIVKITGNASMAGVKNLKDNAKFDLTGDYALNTAGYILLYVNEDKTLKELERTTTAPTAASTDVNFTTATVDANEGSVFRFTGTADTAITNILNGIEGKTIRIYGTDAVDVDVTFSTTGKIKMSSAASLGTKDHYVQLTLTGGFWRDTKRVTA